MILSTPCKSCQEKMEGSYLITDRIEFAQKYGEQISLSCVNCGMEEDYHADDFRAVNNPKMRLILFGAAILIAIIFGVIGSIYIKGSGIAHHVLFYVLITTPFFLFGVYIKNDTDSIRLFNRLKLKGYTVQTQMKSTANRAQISEVDKATSIESKIRKMNSEQLPSSKKTSRGKD